MVAAGARDGPMTTHRHPDPSAPQSARDRELDAWLEHAMGVKTPDPEPVLHDLKD